MLDGAGSRQRRLCQIPIPFFNAVNNGSAPLACGTTAGFMKSAKHCVRFFFFRIVDTVTKKLISIASLAGLGR